MTSLFSCEKAKDLIPGGDLSFKIEDSTVTSNKNLVSGSLLDTLGGYMLVASGSGNSKWIGTINVFFPEKKLQAGTYSSEATPMNALGWVTLPDMDSYSSYNNEASVGSATIVITKISSTHAEGTFTGTLLSDLDPSVTLQVTDGKFDLTITP
ncbi:hypothetical protein MKQ68_23860 [Chitinophaga horti]|uniref:Uncharacterized protein n=1 Tax=Chitinophaga horti TaxID=2920382 RepID=A0ABY6J139_9BACT|nr:hypothetical protein [Chitinophaga horti]UYQ93121.1 hypothetical protein MKQ68_23860 [Chitinophaga horti]